MEDDRAQVDLGIAADIEEAQDTTPRQPKKRFVGRKHAAEAASRDGNAGDSVAVQG
jgi:2-(3-amino-3-carboxypropyl)histidine synthase